MNRIYLYFVNKHLSSWALLGRLGSYQSDEDEIDKGRNKSRAHAVVVNVNKLASLKKKPEEVSGNIFK